MKIENVYPESVSKKFMTLASSDIFCIAVAIQGEVIASQVFETNENGLQKTAIYLNPTLSQNAWFRYEIKLPEGFKVTMLHNQKLAFKDFVFTSVFSNRLNLASEDFISSKPFGYLGRYYSFLLFKTL